jgi:chaperone modulatory protein CbpM
MRRLEEVILIIPEVNREDLDRWINNALIEAQQDADSIMLTDTQFARVRLICTLRYDMDVEEEVLPIVLDLLDQLHESRQRLHNLSQAVLAQNEDVTSSILEVLSEVRRQH